MTLTIEKLPWAMTVSKLSSVPDTSKLTVPFVLSVTDKEISLLSATDAVPPEAIIREDGWRGFRVSGTLDFALIGILAGIAEVLAKAGISIYAVSTYDTDYVLVKQNRFDAALTALSNAGYTIK